MSKRTNRPIIFYGYKLSKLSGFSYLKFLNHLFGLNSIVEEPFQFVGLLTRLDDTEFDTKILDDNATILFGFIPNNNIEIMLKLSKMLREYVLNCPFFDGLDFDMNAGFYSGVHLNEFIDYDSESDDDLGDSETDEDEDEDEEEDSEDEDDDNEDSEEDEDEDEEGDDDDLENKK